MGINFTDCLKKRLFCWVSNPRRGITIAWLISLVLVLVAFIVACISANKISKQSQNTGADTGFGQMSGFAGVWTVLLLILISVIGTIIMRRYQTALSIGFFLGVIFVMCQQMLILFAIFAEHSQAPAQSASDVSAQEAMTVFCFFLFAVYAVFGSLLAVFRHDIIKEEVMSDDQHGGEYGGASDQMPPQEEEEAY